MIGSPTPCSIRREKTFEGSLVTDPGVQIGIQNVDYQVGDNEDAYKDDHYRSAGCNTPVYFQLGGGGNLDGGDTVRPVGVATGKAMAQKGLARDSHVSAISSSRVVIISVQEDLRSPELAKVASIPGSSRLPKAGLMDP